jgi:hypothetical protein
MAWQTEMTTILRYLIGDYGVEQKYTNSELQTLLTVGARFVLHDISFDVNYVVDVSSTGISPDPVDNGDDAFVNFATLKAACLTDEWEMREHTIIEGINAVCGPVKMAIDPGNGFQTLMEHGPCETYETMKDEYLFGNDSNIKAILSPFISNEFNPEDLA